jgi:hypothetical protein
MNMTAKRSGVRGSEEVWFEDKMPGWALADQIGDRSARQVS